MEADDRTEWLLQHTQPLHEPFRPQTEHDALALLSHPASDMSEEVGFPLQPFAERNDVETLQKLQELAVKGLVRVIDTKVSATPPQQGGAMGSSFSVDGDAASDGKLFHSRREGNKEPGSHAQRLSDFKRLWRTLLSRSAADTVPFMVMNSPSRMHCQLFFDPRRSCGCLRRPRVVS